MMGKKNNKYDKMDYHEKQSFLLSQADKYGVDMSNYSQFGDVSGARGHATKSYKDLEEHVVKLSQNDYSNRRAIEAATMAGNKKATKIGQMNEGMNQLAATDKWMEKMHGKHVGGGDYTYGSDSAAVAMHYVERDREKMLKPLVQTSDLNALKEKLQAQATKNAAKPSDPAEPSERLAQAQSRIGAAAYDPGSLYDKNNQNAAKANDQADAARSFLDDYKVDVTKGARLQEDIKSNVGNAASTVTDIYGR